LPSRKAIRSCLNLPVGESILPIRLIKQLNQCELIGY
jgi:hypothetical protein